MKQRHIICISIYLILFFMLCLLPSSNITNLSSYENKVNAIKIYFFYENSCDSCNETQKLYDILADKLRLSHDTSSYRVWTYNVFKASDEITFEHTLSSFKLKKQDISLPWLIIGDQYLCGYDAIKSGIQTLYSSKEGFVPKYSNRLTSPSASDTLQTEISTDSAVADPNLSYGVYFYTLSCSNCEKTKKYLAVLPKSYEIRGKTSQVKIVQKNILDQENTALIRTFFETYHVPSEKQKVPILFLSDRYFAGYDDISAHLEKSLAEGHGLNFIYKQALTTLPPIARSDLWGIFATGFLNGFNPCSISMLFLLLSLLITAKNNILKTGMSFMFGKFVTYLCLGLGFYFLASLIDLQILGSLQFAINVILLIFAIIFAALNLFDFISVLKGNYGSVKLQLPVSFRKFNHNILKKYATPKYSKYIILVVFILGIVISAGEFLCTGQIYLATIIYMLKRSSENFSITLLAFVLYVTAMCLPHIIIIISVSRGKNLLELSEFTRTNFPTIKLLNFMLFFIFAIFLLIIIF